MFKNPKHNILLLILFILSEIPINLLGQDSISIRFERLASENKKIVKGLSQNWIYDIMQDREGYIWFATWYGLNKYDGYTFTTYTTSDGLSNNRINVVFEDENQELWVGTENGLNHFNRQKQTFSQYFHIESDTTSLVNNSIRDIIESADGYLWIGTIQGLSRFDRNTETFQSFFTIPQSYSSPRSNYILDLFIDDLCTLWISTTYGLITFDPVTFRSIRYYALEGDKINLSDNNTRCVLQSRNGDYWIGTANGLSVYKKGVQQTIHYYNNPEDIHSISDNFIRTLFEDKSGKIWIGTNNGGLNIYDEENDNFSHFQYDFENPNSLSNNLVYDITEDYSGNIWLGTFSGASLIKKYANDFNHIHQTANNNKSLNDNIVWSFNEERNKNLWISTEKGINILDRKSQTYRYLIHDPLNENSIADNDSRTLAFDSINNIMWIGIWGEGLDKYDLNTKQFTHYKPIINSNSISSLYVNKILITEDQKLWIATANGLDFFDPEKEAFIVYNHHDKDSTSLCHNTTITLFMDSNNVLWIGTNNGLCKYNPNSNNFTSYCVEENASKGSNTVFSLNEDKDDKIWIGTSGKGVFVLDPIKKQYDTLNMSNGLPNNYIYGILRDRQNNMWLTTNYGLSKYIYLKQVFVNFDIYDGIQSNEFNLGAVYQDNRGLVYFGGMNGFNAFYPQNIISNTKPPPVVISAFKVYNEPYAGNYSNGQEITLNYDDNFFTIEISALDFTNSQKNKYRFKLENFDKDWTYSDANNKIAEYKKVSPGKYIFIANGTNNDGVWGLEDIQLKITIKPPFWNTLVFKIIFFIILILSILKLIKWRIDYVKKKQQMETKLLKIENQKVELEKRALRLQMNPHFIFNSLNSIQSYILLQNRDMAIRYLSKFSKLMRLILANSSSRFVLIKDEINALRHYIELEQLRFENKFDYEIIIDPKIDEDIYKIAPMLIQPYVENAIIHGLMHKASKGFLSIELKKGDDNLVCIITDDGVGRKMAKELEENSQLKKKSVGMEITRQRLQFINEEHILGHQVEVDDLMNNDGESAGTRVKIKMIYKFS